MPDLTLDEMVHRKIYTESLLERAKRLDGHAQIYDAPYFSLESMVLDIDPDPIVTLQTIYDAVTENLSDLEIAMVVKGEYAKLLDKVES